MKILLAVSLLVSSCANDGTRWSRKVTVGYENASFSYEWTSLGGKSPVPVNPQK